MKIKSHKQLVEEASLEIESLTPEEAKARFDDNTIFIDIRDIRELWREGTVARLMRFLLACSRSSPATSHFKLLE